MIDLALKAGQKRQSPRTGFVHTFHGDANARDTIPIYENGCFVLALLGSKKTELALEGRELLLRLLAFQSPEGNFPTYLHDYPRCYDGLLALKMGAVLHQILKEHKQILNAEVKEKTEQALSRALRFTQGRREQKPLPSLWEFRYLMLSTGDCSFLDTSHFSPADWWEYWVSLQCANSPISNFVHPELGLFVGPSFGDEQEELEPAPQLIEWKVAEVLGHFSPRLLKDHVRQLELSLLKQVEVAPLSEKIPGWHVVNTSESSYLAAEQADPSMEYALRWAWKGEVIHSLVLPTGEYACCSTAEKVFTIDLPALTEVSRNDLYEIAFYKNASPETTLFIDGKKGTVFSLGNKLSIVTPLKTVTLEFSLIEGEAKFCGHIFRGNRPCQRSLSGALEHAAFDWKIALRTLRRSGPCRLKIHLTS